MGFFRRKAPSGRPDSTSSPPRSIAVSRELDWRAYDPVAKEYARVMAPRVALPARDLVDMLALQPGRLVLDVGTGTGVAARAAAGAGARVVGVDVAVQMVRQAHSEDGGPRYAVAAAIDLPFPDGTFDAVVSTFALSHFTKYDTALFDMLRVLRPGGRLGVSTWAPGHDEFMSAWQEVAEQFAHRRILRDARQRAMPWDEVFTDKHRLTEALFRAGLRGLRAETREYLFEMTTEDYLVSREIAATGRFLREMLGEQLWERFRRRTREVFGERFPARFNDFRDVHLVVGTKPLP